MAIGMVAFLALHQHILARHPDVDTRPLCVNSVTAVLRSLLACCHDRISSADNAGTLASTLVLLIQSAEPEDPYVCSQNVTVTLNSLSWQGDTPSTAPAHRIVGRRKRCCRSHSRHRLVARLRHQGPGMGHSDRHVPRAPASRPSAQRSRYLPPASQLSAFECPADAALGHADHQPQVSLGVL